MPAYMRDDFKLLLAELSKMFTVTCYSALACLGCFVRVWCRQIGLWVVHHQDARTGKGG